MLPDQQELIKLVLALLVGGLIGFEREAHAKAAGLRTITLITVGATLFTMLSSHFSPDTPGRVAANIVVGVGFLGAGAILFSEGRVRGLTTASSIWVAAAVGMAIGLGDYALAAAATVLVIVVLWLFTGFDRLIDVVGGEVRTYEITFLPREGKFDDIEKQIAASGLKTIRKRRRKIAADRQQAECELRGALMRHNQFTDGLLADGDVTEVNY